jgi:hypothetical protein
MNKQDKANRASKMIVIRRCNVAYKASKIKSNVLHISSDKLNEALAVCKTQASLIDAALRNSMTLEQTATVLFERDMCTSIDTAYARIKRHIKHDETSRIVKRAVILSSAIKALMTKEREQIEVAEIAVAE